MVIEKRKNVRIIPNKLNEGRKTAIASKLLKEELGAFKEQYQISDIITDGLKAPIENMRSCNVNITIGSSVLDSVSVNIVFGEDGGTDFMVPRASLDDYNCEGKTCTITLCLPSSTRSQSWKSVSYSVNHIIAHELMHYFIFVKRAIKGVPLNDIPEDYRYWIEVLRNSDTTDLTYSFTYGLYSTFYHEINAIVSQSSRSVKAFLFGNDMQPTTENIRNALSRNEMYGSLLSNMKFVKRYFGKEKVYEKISRELSELTEGNLSYDNKMMKRLFLRIYTASNNAISKIHKNMAWLIKTQGE